MSQPNLPTPQSDNEGFIFNIHDYIMIFLLILGLLAGVWAYNEWKKKQQPPEEQKPPQPKKKVVNLNDYRKRDSIFKKDKDRK